MSNDQLFDRFEALTFDDVVIVPGYSNVLPDSVDTTARFAADIELAVPLVSAAMDKVTEARMAIAIAREGGIGTIHRNLSIADQAADQATMPGDVDTCIAAHHLIHDASARDSRRRRRGRRGGRGRGRPASSRAPVR